jgi:hypothetical protein
MMLGSNDTKNQKKKSRKCGWNLNENPYNMQIKELTFQRKFLSKLCRIIKTVSLDVLNLHKNLSEQTATRYRQDYAMCFHKFIWKNICEIFSGNNQCLSKNIQFVFKYKIERTNDYILYVFEWACYILDKSIIKDSKTQNIKHPLHIGLYLFYILPLYRFRWQYFKFICFFEIQY